jgi:hypothetical protein
MRLARSSGRLIPPMAAKARVSYKLGAIRDLYLRTTTMSAVTKRACI